MKIKENVLPSLELLGFKVMYNYKMYSLTAFYIFFINILWQILREIFFSFIFVNQRWYNCRIHPHRQAGWHIRITSLSLFCLTMMPDRSGDTYSFSIVCLAHFNLGVGAYDPRALEFAKDHTTSPIWILVGFLLKSQSFLQWGMFQVKSVKLTQC